MEFVEKNKWKPGFHKFNMDLQIKSHELNAIFSQRHPFVMIPLHLIKDVFS